MNVTDAAARKAEAAILRFAPAYRRRLRKLVSVSPRLGDLLVSFPAAAFALVSGHGDADQRGASVRAVKSGAGLRDVACQIGLPMWLKRLPPEAFSEPLGVVPDGDAFARAVSALVPTETGACAAWLRWTLFAHRCCGEPFALWIASQEFDPYGDGLGRVPLAPMAAYVWFSGRPEGELARSLIRRPWSSKMGVRAAVCETGAWIDRIAGELRPVPRRRGPGRYSQRNARSGYHFVVLHTGAQLREEGRWMDHCVGSYAKEVSDGKSIIVSIRRGNLRVATMELVAREQSAGTYNVVQIHGPSNSRPSALVRRLAGDWLIKNARGRVVANPEFDAFPVDAKRWEHLWRPYVSAKGEGWLKGEPLNLPRLICDAEQLAAHV